MPEKHYPKRLSGPLTIGVAACMSWVRESGGVERCVRRFEAMGHRVALDAHVRAKHQYFSAPDDMRAAAFMEMVDDPTIDLIMPARGGYGMTRLLPMLDFERVVASRKSFIGFSDFTAFSFAALTHGFVTFAGPMAVTDFGREQNPDPFMLDAFNGVLMHRACRIEGVRCEHPHAPRSIEGTLWGTNLSVVAHLVGTRYMPHIADGILVLEDIGEEPYALDRALMQLWHAGILQRQRALVFGAFNGYDETSPVAAAFTREDLAEHWRERLGVPVLTGLPFGHVAKKLTLPTGGHCLLDVERDGYSLTLSDYAT